MTMSKQKLELTWIGRKGPKLSPHLLEDPESHTRHVRVSDGDIFDNR